MGRDEGQAAPEYIAILAIVGTLLLAAAVRSHPAIESSIVRHLRTALCIVGGDICRASDAAAAGLDPCVVTADSGARKTGLTILFLRSGEESGFTVERRSDGSVAVTKVRGKDLGASASLGVSIAGDAKLNASGTATLRWQSGRAWELPDEAALRRVLGRLGPHAKPEALALLIERERPAATYLAGGAVFSGAAAADLFGGSLPLGDAAVGETLGRRVGREGTTWFLEASAIGPHLLGRTASGPRAWTLELAERDDAARELVLRGRRDGERSEEVTARLDLSQPANRAAARDLLGLKPPWTPAALARLGAIGRHLLVASKVERRAYRETDIPGRDWGASVGAFGFDHATSARRRELVEAVVYGPDGSIARRVDCLGLDA